MAEASLQSAAKDLLGTIDAAMDVRRIGPGFIIRPPDFAKPVGLPPWFIDRCRRAYLSARQDTDHRVIGVTSASHGEGKSSVAIGIATAIAADTREPTLLLECELERPSFCDFFGVPAERGLTEWLDNTAALRIIRVPYLPQLVVIPAGAPHPDPARLLYQITETNVIADLTQRFRNIVLDLPPMLDIAYSSLASRLAERILVVARYGETPMEDLERLIFLLGRERISGLILNGTDFRTPGWLRRLF